MVWVYSEAIFCCEFQGVFVLNFHVKCMYAPGSKVAIYGMVIPPWTGNPYDRYIKPLLLGLNFRPLSYGKNASFRPPAYIARPIWKQVVNENHGIFLTLWSHSSYVLAMCYSHVVGVLYLRDSWHVPSNILLYLHTYLYISKSNCMIMLRIILTQSHTW